jgi:hypothetical protein
MRELCSEGRAGDIIGIRSELVDRILWLWDGSIGRDVGALRLDHVAA